MHDDFERRIRASAVAGWWVVLISAVAFVASWLFYLAVIPAQPEWLLRLWGPNMNWDYVQEVWFSAIVAFKLIVWAMAMVALWLTLWARQMRRSGGGT